MQSSQEFFENNNFIYIKDIISENERYELIEKYRKDSKYVFYNPVLDSSLSELVGIELTQVISRFHFNSDSYRGLYDINAISCDICLTSDSKNLPRFVLPSGTIDIRPGDAILSKIIEPKIEFDIGKFLSLKYSPKEMIISADTSITPNSIYSEIVDLINDVEESLSKINDAKYNIEEKLKVLKQKIS